VLLPTLHSRAVLRIPFSLASETGIASSTFMSADYQLMPLGGGADNLGLPLPRVAGALFPRNGLAAMGMKPIDDIATVQPASKHRRLRPRIGAFPTSQKINKANVEGLARSAEARLPASGATRSFFDKTQGFRILSHHVRFGPASMSKSSERI
jgi:hypothetical protein